MNWIKTTSIIPTWQTLGDYLNNQLFEIIGSRYSGFTLTTRIGNDHSN